MPATHLNRCAPWLVAILLYSFNAGGQPLSLFPGLTVKNDSHINLIADAPGGGYFLATMVDAVNGTPTGNIAKVSTSGAVDPNFEKVVVNGDIFSIVPLQNGQILIAGRFTKVNGLAYHGIARLESDGNLDTSFPVPFDPLVDVGRLAVQSDGKILVVGRLQIPGHDTILRLNANGTLDATFVYNPVTALGFGLAVVVDNQDNIWLTDSKSIFRLNPAGAIQSGFPISVGAGMTVYYMVPKGDKLYVGGPFTTISGISRPGMALVNADGSIDTGFAPTNVPDVNGLEVKTDGKVVALHLNVVQVYNSNGSLFSQIASSQPESIHVDPNQNTLVAGSINLLLKGNQVPLLGRVDNNFAIDNSFICKPTFSHGVTSTAGYPDGRILVGGTYEVIGFNSSLKRLVRVMRDGTVDPTFDAAIPSSSVLPRFSILGLLIQQDERIVVTTNEKMFRLLPGGGVDNSFPQITAPTLGLFSRGKEKSGKFLLSGAFDAVSSYSSPGILRLTSNGIVDNSFVSGLPAGSYVTDFAFQSDNKIIVVGNFPASPAKSEMRLLPNGGVDNSFTSGSVASNGVYKVGVDSQDRIYLAGGFFNYDGSGRNNLVRLGVNGQLDANFNFSPATIESNSQVESLEILSDNEIVVGGRQTYGDNALFVFDATGGLIDKPFTHLGQNPSITSLHFNGQTLYLGGHLVSSNSDVTAGLGVVNIVPVTGTLDNLVVSRSSRYQADLSWDNNINNENFVAIERSEGNGPFVELVVLNPLTNAYSDVGIKGVADYHYRLRAFNSSSFSNYSGTGTIPALPKLDQTITFESIPDKSFGTSPFAMVFNATSALPVTISSSNPTIATVAGSIVTINAHGTVVFTAQQAGDLEHNAAPAVERTLTITLALGAVRSSRYQATLTWQDKTGGGSIVIERSEGNANSFAEIATIPISSPNYVDIGIKGVAQYFYRIRDLNLVPYSNTASITAEPKLNQSITFASIPAKILEDDPFNLTFSASSGLPVTISSSDPTIASVEDGTVTILAIGTVTLSAEQVGDLEYNAAPSVSRTLVITLVMALGENPDEGKIAFPNPSDGVLQLKMGTTAFAGTAYVHNSSGSLVATLPVQSANGLFQLDLSNFPAGVYIVKVQDRKSESTFKLIRK